MKNYLITTRSIQAILFAYPVLLLTVKGGMGTGFILLVALSVYLMFCNASSGIRQNMDRDLVLFGVSMSATIISIMLSQFYHLSANARDFDSASRFLFSIPIFLVLRETDYKVFKPLQYGLAVGAILIGFIIVISGQKMIASTYFLIHIHLGDLALMLGFLSVFSINWMQKDSHFVVILKVIGLVAGLYVSMVSGARGGWAAIPIFLLIWILLSPNFKNGLVIKLIITVAAMIFGSVVGYMTINVVHVRMDAAIHDLTAVTPDTSLGIRFQLWKAAVQLFMQNPVFGVGADGFALAMDRMADSGVVTRMAADIGKGEVHSYYFATLARYGIAGMISLALLFFLPMRMFYKASSSQYQFHRVAARMGLCVVLGFLVFCITVEMFNLKMIATFYGMTVAVLLSAATNRTVGKVAN
ncbi:hypothetical protein MIZ01_2607 [Sideroxyarcus emersonii]|uniref:O-antigen ligase-related domain-containing protein n=1 Tax=Sideroxyarcus emersonii TaxID=2764705 RepID=A0AAN1XCN5_9PROT|nr:O-antigen ligase family protein [Sideroxyarcus emersonii]BCK88801.1 hypothetical protein MIZ01_2607 [Sideroxyarcus emersonii]